MAPRARKGSTLDPTDILGRAAKAAQAPVRPLAELEDLPMEDVSTELAIIDNGQDGAFDGDEEAEEIAFERNLLEKRISDTFPAEYVKILRRIAYYISKVGLTLKESLALVQVSTEEFEKNMRLYPVIGELIVLKELEFKADILATISSKARQGNDKLATWMLQNRYPDEFNQKKGGGQGGGDDGEDMIAMGYEFVQKHGDSSPMVSETSGRAFIVQKSNGKTPAEIKQSIQEMLNG